MFGLGDGRRREREGGEQLFIRIAQDMKEVRSRGGFKSRTSDEQGRNCVILRGGQRYIHNRKNKNVFGLYLETCPLTLAKVKNAGGGAPAPQLRPW